MTVVTLESIPDAERKKVRLIERIRDERQRPADVELVSVEPERNSIKVGGRSYPINQIRAVWYNGTQWCISVDYLDMA